MKLTRAFVLTATLIQVLGLSSAHASAYSLCYQDAFATCAKTNSAFDGLTSTSPGVRIHAMSISENGARYTWEVSYQGTPVCQVKNAFYSITNGGGLCSSTVPIIGNPGDQR